MTRSTAALPLIGLILAGYGIYTALYLPPMLLGPPMPFLIVAFVWQVVAALAAAVGVWRGQRWASTAVLLLGAGIVATQLIEVALGVPPYLRAVMVSTLAIIGALVLASYVRRSPHLA
jgi:hypothetical protein